MQKIKLGAVALALAAPAAFAQSSVTVYGIVDVAGQWAKGHATSAQEISGGLAGSRIGFKGTEDLGDGYKVDFVLEGGLNIDSGSSAQGGALFGRQAFGDIKGPFGTVSAGRQYSSLYTVSGDFSAFSNVNDGASTSVLGGFANGYEPIRGGGTTANTAGNSSSVNGGPARVNNSFRYTTPKFSGFTASVLYGAGEVTGGFSDTRLIDYSARYTNYGLDAMVGYVDDKSVASGINVGTLIAGASYAFGPAHIEGGAMHVNDKSATNRDGNGFWVGGDYRLGANLFKAQWLLNKALYQGLAGTSRSENKTNVFGVGYQYDFSKRTAFYTDLTRFQNGDGAGYGRWSGGGAISSTAGLTTLGDNDVTEFVIGVRHAF